MIRAVSEENEWEQVPLGWNWVSTGGSEGEWRAVGDQGLRGGGDGKFAPAVGPEKQESQLPWAVSFQESE